MSKRRMNVFAIVSRRQKNLAEKAQRDANYKFDDLLSLLSGLQWVGHSFYRVVTNTGAKTSGVDGINKAHFLRKDGKELSVRKVNNFVTKLSDDLRRRRYKPQPVKRVYIPKPRSEELRPLGIPTFRDRVAQDCFRALFEPIWESDFLDVSYGFRPQRNTWHAVIRTQLVVINKYHWVIEGDLRKFFDTVNHQILLSQLRRRIKDWKVINIVRDILKSGVLDDGLFSNVLEGTPQGGVFSPLLSNIYLHQFDSWYMKRWNLTKSQRAYRRRKELGAFSLIRYVDDWIILTNAPRKLVELEREEICQFLHTIRLKLNMDKTRITHLRDGFNFLGFNCRVFSQKHSNKVFYRINPRKDNIIRFRYKIKSLTKRDSVNVEYRSKLIALNQVIRGWGYYYRYTHSYKIFTLLDWYVSQRMLRWLKAKTQKGANYCLKRYQLRKENRNEWGSKAIPNTQEKDIFLFRLATIGVESDPRIQAKKGVRTPPKGTPYIFEYDDSEDQPYLLGITNRFAEKTDKERTLLIPKDWQGNVGMPGHPDGWSAKARRTKTFDVRCVDCGAITDLAVHHRRHKDESGRLNRTLCRECHQELHKQLKK